MTSLSGRSAGSAASKTKIRALWPSAGVGIHVTELNSERSEGTGGRSCFSSTRGTEITVATVQPGRDSGGLPHCSIRRLPPVYSGVTPDSCVNAAAQTSELNVGSPSGCRLALGRRCRHSNDESRPATAAANGRSGIPTANRRTLRFFFFRDISRDPIRDPLPPALLRKPPFSRGFLKAPTGIEPV